MNKSMITGITLGVATVAVGVGVAFNFMGGGGAVYSPSAFENQQYRISQQSQNYGYTDRSAEGSSIHETTKIAGRQLRDYENTYSQERAGRGETGQVGSTKRVAQIDGRQTGGGGYSSDIAVGTGIELQKQLGDIERMSADAQKQAKMNQNKQKDGGMFQKLKSSFGLGGQKSGSTSTSGTGSVGPSGSVGTAGTAPTASQQAMMDANIKEMKNISKSLDIQRGRTGSFSQQGSSSTNDGPSKLTQTESQPDFAGTTDLKIVQGLTADAASKNKRELSSSAGLDPFSGTSDGGGTSIDGSLAYTSADQILDDLDEDLFDGDIGATVEDLESQEDDANAARKKHMTNCILLASGALLAIVALGIIGPPIWEFTNGKILVFLLVAIILTLILFLVKQATLLSQYSGDSAGIFMGISSLLTLGLMLVLLEVVIKLKSPVLSGIISSVGTFLTEVGKDAAQTSAQKDIQEDNEDKFGGGG